VWKTHVERMAECDLGLRVNVDDGKYEEG
jgi:hypothetical protein